MANTCAPGPLLCFPSFINMHAPPLHPASLCPLGRVPATASKQPAPQPLPSLLQDSLPKRRRKKKREKRERGRKRRRLYTSPPHIRGSMQPHSLTPLPPLPPSSLPLAAIPLRQHTQSSLSSRRPPFAIFAHPSFCLEIPASSSSCCAINLWEGRQRGSSPAARKRAIARPKRKPAPELKKKATKERQTREA